MTEEIALQKIQLGEGVTQEFKRCGGSIEKDVLETVCSFLNRFGGDIFLGVNDDGSIEGVSEKAAPQLIRNLNNLLNDENLFSPVCVVSSEIVKVEDKTIICVHVAPSSTLHTLKGKFYDRTGDVDIVIKNDAIATAYIRKKNIFTERKVFPYLKLEHLNTDTIEYARKLAVVENQNHPWRTMSHEEILRSAGLYGHDYENDKDGLTLAAGVLFGRDDVLRDLCPNYWTDALCRKVDTIRYDDREIIETNLINSVALLMDFARKHTNDKFYLNEEGRRESLRSNICREMIVNCLIHREFTDARISRFIIEKDKMYTENACIPQYPGEITPENLDPRPRNPLVAKVFREIHFSDQLGSGMRKLYHDVPLYSGFAKPQFLDGNVFRLIVPLNDDVPSASEMDGKTKQETRVENDNYTLVNTENYPRTDETGKENGISTLVNDNINEKTRVENKKTRVEILNLIKENPTIKTVELAEKLSITKKGVEWQLKQLRDDGLLRHVGATKNGHWEIIKEEK